LAVAGERGSPIHPREFGTDEKAREIRESFESIFGYSGKAGLRQNVSGHYNPASKGRNDPATKICVSRHFSSKQARNTSLVWGLFERKMPLFS
jgi:hypothetical protein